MLNFKGKKRNVLGFQKWLTWRFAAIGFIVWLISMVCITLNTATNHLSIMVSEATEYNHDLKDRVWYSPFHQDAMMMDVVQTHCDIDDGIEMNTAVLFQDNSGKVLLKSGDYATIRYCNETEFFSNEDNSHQWQYGWINIDRDLNPLLYNSFCNFNDYITNETWEKADRIEYLKLTGRFNGSEFIPATIKMITQQEAEAALMYASNEPLTLFQTRIAKDLIKVGNLKWNLLYENPEYNSQEQVETVYAIPYNLDLIYYYDKGSSFSYENKQYDSIIELLEEKSKVLTKFHKIDSPGEYTLFKMVYFGGTYYEEKDLGIYTVVAGSPLFSAFHSLTRVYISTLILVILCVFLLSYDVKRKVMVPLNEVNWAMGSGWKYAMTSRILNNCDTPELADLMDNYRLIQNQMREDKDEIKRLNTALDYAKDAEESRRQLTSNLAHEVKTPLAVIRSYSEGLQERIAEDKRDRYVQVIMDETDKLDSMVLEMLDLSRLEAGRVKLKRDTFSLAVMAKSTFQRLSLLAEDKGLDVTFDFKDDCVILADEIRISQVITNLASNAVKYTPEGGWIHVSGSIKNGEVYFAVQNTSPPLHYEQLNKVWETFYRTDESRNSQGTGLGLAIAKNIVELHGGKVHAKNIKDGVEFGFKIKTTNCMDTNLVQMIT